MTALARLRTSALARTARRVEARDPERAAHLLRRAGDPVSRALAAEVDLRRGVIPADLDHVRQVLADSADAAHASGATDQALRLLTRLVALSFHRAVQLDGPSSPLAEDPEQFLAPLRSSMAWRWLTAPRGAAPGPVPHAGPLRVCVVADGDLRFLAPLLPHLGPDVEVDVVDLSAWDGPRLPLTPAEQVRARADTAVATSPWARELSKRIGRPDVIWVEWCQRAAVLVSLTQVSAPVVVRLHSFEAFTAFPHLLDPSRVAAVVTVSPAFGELVRAAVPALADVVQVLPNALEPGPFALAKEPGAEHTLGLVGWGAPAKDACWAVDVLAELRRADPRWRLRLVGAPPTAPGYAAAVQARLDDLGDAVEVVGPSDDVPGELRRIGALVSASTRESFHLAVGEAAASGARVAVRDWPTLSPYGGPHGVWPDDWVVTTPQEAAALLLSDRPVSPAPDLRAVTVAGRYRAVLAEVAGRPG
ncbi:MAG TPA: glycosyltransferase [Mycobacteriales bacterium]|nr:glycosyltransferase [Mycobacteriales bacterium]